MPVTRLTCLLLIFALIGCEAPQDGSAARNNQPLSSWLDSQIPAWLQQFEIPGASVALVEAGEIALLKGYGYASMERRIPMTDAHVFNVASLSKPVTAWGVMRLIEQGDIELDQPVNRYLKRWQLADGAGSADEVTVRRLLSHTAGLSMPSTPGFRWPMDVPELTSVLNGEYVNSTYARSGTKVEIVHEPGDVFHYSGGGYLVLQLVVEEVTGRPFRDYMQESVLAPLDMNSSQYGWDPQLNGRMATPYLASGNVEDIFRLPGQAASSLHASAKDLANWMVAAVNPEPGQPVISPSAFKLMLQPVVAVPDGQGDLESMGLGYFVERTGNAFIAGHSGGNAGWRARFLMSPSEGDGILVLTNSDAGDQLIDRISCAWAANRERLKRFMACDG